MVVFTHLPSSETPPQARRRLFIAHHAASQKTSLMRYDAQFHPCAPRRTTPHFPITFANPCIDALCATHSAASWQRWRLGWGLTSRTFDSWSTGAPREQLKVIINKREERGVTERRVNASCSSVRATFRAWSGSSRTPHRRRRPPPPPPPPRRRACLDSRRRGRGMERWLLTCSSAFRCSRQCARASHCFFSLWPFSLFYNVITFFLYMVP